MRLITTIIIAVFFLGCGDEGGSPDAESLSASDNASISQDMNLNLNACPQTNEQLSEPHEGEGLEAPNASTQGCANVQIALNGGTITNVTVLGNSVNSADDAEQAQLPVQIARVKIPDYGCNSVDGLLFCSDAVAVGCHEIADQVQFYGFVCDGAA